MRAEQFPNRRAQRFRPRVPHGDVDRAGCPAMEAHVAEVFALFLVVRDERAGAMDFPAERHRRDVAQRTEYRLRRVVEREQVAVAGDAIVEFEASDDERNLWNLMRAVRNGL